MKILTFKYTDTKGKVSNRTLGVGGTPTDKYSGVDVSSLDPELLKQYATAIDEMKEIYAEGLAALNAQFDLKYNYRQFFVSNMCDVEESNI